MQRVKTKYFEYGKEEMEYLKSVDIKLGSVMDNMGKVKRIVIPDLFPALLNAIVGQQISVKATNTIWERMQLTFDDITPKVLAFSEVSKIQHCGMSTRKASYIKGIAETVFSGGINLEQLKELSDSEVINRLSSLKGVGVWTAEMLLLNSMERKDVLSFGDIAIRRGMMKLYGLENINQEQFDEYKKVYSPYGSIASIYLWKLSSVNKEEHKC